MRVNYFIQLFLILSIAIMAQERCSSCRKDITGRYLQVNGMYFHPEHFTCHECKKPIVGEYFMNQGYYLHRECNNRREGLFCASCGKAIETSHVVFNDKKYHQECYTNNIARRCNICMQPIESEYYTEPNGAVYHAKHAQEFPKCDNCNSLIHENTTGKGSMYADGRNMCGRCTHSAVFDQTSLQMLAKKVHNVLFHLGIEVNIDKVPFSMVDRNRLEFVARDIYSDQLRGYCSVSEETTSLNTIVTTVEVSKKVTMSIVILSGMPQLDTEQTLAHEMMHAWIYQNMGANYQHKLVEGFCNFASYLYLLQSNAKNKDELLRRMEQNPDPVYGDGFRTIKENFAGKSVSEFLLHIKANY